jgi:hypothetical protein
MSVSPQIPAPRSRFRGPYRLLLVMAVLFVVVVFLFPVVFPPRIDVSTGLKFASPSSMPVRISNQNLTPLNHVEYACELSQLTLANGSVVTNAKVLTRGTILTVPGRRAVTIRCETAYIVTAAIKSAEYDLTLHYRAYPWPQQRARSYRIVSQVDANGSVTGWKLQ